MAKKNSHPAVVPEYPKSIKNVDKPTPREARAMTAAEKKHMAGWARELAIR